MIVMIIDKANLEQFHILKTDLQMLKGLEYGDMNGLIEVKKVIMNPHNIGLMKAGDRFKWHPDKLFVIDSNTISLNLDEGQELEDFRDMKKR